MPFPHRWGHWKGNTLASLSSKHFWLLAGIPTLSGPINQRPAGKGAGREPSTRGWHPVTRQGRESGEHPGRNTKGGESSPVLPEVGCYVRFTNLLHTHECVCVCVCVMENGNDAHLKIPNLLHWMRFGCSHLVSLLCSKLLCIPIFINLVRCNAEYK